MRIEEALRWAQERLRDVAERPLLEAEILLSHAIGEERVYLHTHPRKVIDTTLFRRWVERRALHEPIEYIVGEVSFYGESFLIEPGVLIPRPETEILIDEVAKRLEGEERVAEIGVGSGVIAITLAKMFPKLQITATDINPKALSLAKKNMDRFGVHIDLVHTSFLDGVKGEFDVIVSNPPYIRKGYPLAKNVAMYEPKEALFGGERGEETLLRIIDIFYASEAKMLACEIGYDQKEVIEAYIKEGSCTFYKDLAGFYRGFILRREK